MLLTQKNYQDAVDVEGTVFEADADKRTFHVRLEDGSSVPGDFSQEQEELILSALKEHHKAAVRIQGTGRYDSANRLERIEEVDELSIVEEEPVSPSGLSDRIDYLKSLREGWLGGEEGLPPKAEDLDWARDFLMALHEEEELALPYLYPTPDGNLEVEWSIDGWELSAAIDLPNRLASLDSLHTSSGATKKEEVDLGTPDGKLAFVRFVSSFRTKDHLS